ncbi:MAG: sugar ABC transporter permease, partial [Clostridia bacterium]|nr:sugar ABC transporter permease [Clostridia bacterium]
NFMDSINRTFYIALINVFLTNVLAMTFAIALTSSFKLNNLFRAVIFLPNVISMVISGFIWQFMFTRISTSAYKATGLELFNVSWLGDTQNVIYAIVIVSLWQGLGYIMTIYIAGLMGVDESLVEAAEIDGASGWQVFFRIKLPVMLPVITVGAFLNIAGSLKIFDIIYSLTGGGPGRASEVAMLNIYREAFVFNRFGYGTAKAVILSIIIILITIIQLRITSRKEVDM